MPPDYWQTDNSNGLVMVVHNYHWLNSASRVLISTCSAPLVQTGEHKQFSLFDLDLWPTTLTYNPRLTKVKVDPHAKIKVKGQTVQTGERPQTNGQTRTHGRYQTYYLPCYAADKNVVILVLVLKVWSWSSASAVVTFSWRHTEAIMAILVADLTPGEQTTMCTLSLSKIW